MTYERERNPGDIATTLGTKTVDSERRHLTPEQKRDLIAKLLEKDPSKSDRSIAKLVGASHHTVKKVRGSNGQIAHKDRTEASGRKAGGRKPNPVTKPACASPKDRTLAHTPKVNATPPLNSLSWSEATPEQRIKFIDAIGLTSLWAAMTGEQQQKLCDVIDAAVDAQEAAHAAQTA